MKIDSTKKLLFALAGMAVGYLLMDLGDILAALFG